MSIIYLLLCCPPLHLQALAVFLSPWPLVQQKPQIHLEINKLKISYNSKDPYAVLERM